MIRTKLRTVAAAAGAAALLAIPAGAAVTGDTTVTFQVAAGDGLSLGFAGTSASLTTGDGLLDGLTFQDQVFSGALPAVTVTDSRRQLAGTWGVNIGMKDSFATGSGDSAYSIDNENVAAYLNVADVQALLSGVTLSGAMTPTAAATLANKAVLDQARSLVSGTTVLSGSMTFTPHIDVEVPGDAPAGTYTGVVTQTVS